MPLMSPTPSIVYAVIAALANVVGAVAVTSRRSWSDRSLELLIAFSAGFMISVSLVDIIPEAISTSGMQAGVLILAGFLLVHLTQHVFVHHFHFGEETHAVSQQVGVAALIGLLLHTFVDGVRGDRAPQTPRGRSDRIIVPRRRREPRDGLWRGRTARRSDNTRRGVDDGVVATRVERLGAQWWRDAVCGGVESDS
jgi:hypothetical protein